MKLLSIDMARSIWLLPTSDLNPKGKYIRHVLDEIIRRYSFVRKINNDDSTKTDDDIFLEKGRFTNKNNEDLEISLSLHNDGMVADTRSSTDDSDEFLDEILCWLHTEYELIDYKKLITNKIYISQVYVQSNYSLSTINPKLSDFLKKVSSSIEGHEPTSLEVTGLTCSPDPGGLSKAAPFRVERAINTPFKDNRYYSAGPFKTNTHLSLLEEFEDIIS